MNLQAVFLRAVRFPLIMAVLVNLLLVIRVPLTRTKEEPASVRLANVEGDPALQGASLAEPTGWPMADEFPPRQPGDTTAIVTEPPNLVWTEPDSSHIVPLQGSVDLSRWFDRVAQARRKLRQDMKNLNVLVQEDEHRSDSREMAHGKAPVEVAQKPTSDRPHEQRGKSESQVFFLHNPKRNSGEVFCLVNGKEYLLRAGQSHQFTDGPTWLVEFHRGGDFGIAERMLASGSYEFTVTDGGWDIAKTRRQSPPKP